LTESLFIVQVKGQKEEGIMTPVIFKKCEGEVTAVFPTLPGDMSEYTMTCYAHVGQHGIAHEQWVRSAKPAKPSEYADLLRELRGIGYDDLVIRKRLNPDRDRAARKAVA
jgi:hypothetical protein